MLCTTGMESISTAYDNGMISRYSYNKGLGRRVIDYLYDVFNKTEAEG